jgi:peptidoglycan hydrolase FlgJ
MADDIDRIFKPQTMALKPTHYLKRPAKTVSFDKDAQEDRQTLKLKAACDSFEALFTQQLLKQMRATVPENPLFGGGSAEQIYTEMLDAELSKEMTGSGGLGISRLLFEYMTTTHKTRSDTKD